MKNDHVMQELVRLNSGISDLAYAAENIWFSRKSEFAALTETLTACGRKR